MFNNIITTIYYICIHIYIYICFASLYIARLYNEFHYKIHANFRHECLSDSGRFGRWLVGQQTVDQNHTVQTYYISHAGHIFMGMRSQSTTGNTRAENALYDAFANDAGALHQHFSFSFIIHPAAAAAARLSYL